MCTTYDAETMATCAPFLRDPQPSWETQTMGRANLSPHQSLATQKSWPTTFAAAKVLRVRVCSLGVRIYVERERGRARARETGECAV